MYNENIKVDFEIMRQRLALKSICFYKQET